jgi:hypothetical protein
MFCWTERQRESRWFYRHVLAEYIQQIPKSLCGASLWHRISSFVLQHTYKIWWVAMSCLKLQRWHICWHSQSGSLCKIPQSVIGHIWLSISTQFVLQWTCKECFVFTIFLPVTKLMIPLQSCEVSGSSFLIWLLRYDHNSSMLVEGDSTYFSMCSLPLCGHVTAFMQWSSSGNGILSTVKQQMTLGRGRFCCDTKWKFAQLEKE